jgi:hypothetical protein
MNNKEEEAYKYVSSSFSFYTLWGNYARIIQKLMKEVAFFMKCKRWRRILVMAMIMAMTLSTTVLGAQPDVLMQMQSINMQVVEGTGSVKLPVKTITSYSSLLNYMEDDANFATVRSEGKETYLIFTAPKTGNLCLTMVNAYSADPVKVTIYPVKNQTKVTTLSGSLKEQASFTKYVPVTSGTKYQICVSNTVEGDTFVACAMVILGGSSFDLATSYKIATGYDSNKKSYTTYWKVKAVGNRRLTVSAYDVNYFEMGGSQKEIKISLCNSSKKVISATSSLKTFTEKGDTYADNVTYGVSGSDKGTTYYLKVQTASPLYGIKYDSSKYTTKPGTSKNKATSLASGKAKKAVLAASTSKATQWYKIRVTKKAKHTIKFDGNVAPGTQITMSLVNSHGKTVKALTLKGKSHYNNTGTISGTLAKGTYYVKIAKNSTKSNAAYKLTYK